MMGMACQSPPMHRQQLLLVQPGLPRANPESPLSVPLKIHTTADQSNNSELGVSAAGFNSADVPITHPPQPYRAPGLF